MRHLLIALALAASVPALAVPMHFSHQGRLFDSAGVPLEGAHSLGVALYDVANGGSPIWVDTINATLENGHYAIRLGASEGIDADDVDVDNLYLELSIDGGAPLPERLLVSSVPYALRAQAAATAGALEAPLPWDQLSGVPETLTDGDDDTLADLLCDAGDVPTYDGAAWGCASPTPASVDVTTLSGTIDIDNLPVGSGPEQVAAGDHAHSFGQITGVAALSQLPVGTSADTVAAGDHAHSFGQITGIAAYSQLPVGTAANTVAAGDHTHGFAAITGTLDAARLSGTVDAARLPPEALSSGGGALLLSVDFDESSGTSFADSSGVGNALQVVGGGVSAGSLGHALRAVAFSGGAVRAPQGNTIPDSPYVTFESWIRPNTSLNGTQTLALKSGAWMVEQKAGKMEFTVTTATGPCAVAFPTANVLGEWTHVAAYYNGRIAAIVLDGAERTVACAKGPIAASEGDPLYIGANASGGNAFLGFVDELRLWAHAPLQSLAESRSDEGAATASCKAILDAGASTGNGNYNIDPDGPGGMPAYQVWCDMSGGGWTYKANGVKFRLDYTGYPQSVTAPIVGAEYDFSIAGAASGLKLTGNETPIAYDGLAQGGRAQGRKVMEPSQTFWIHVGGQGTSAGPMDSGACRSQWGGWNGGGRGSRGGAGGGGATDVRLRDGDLSARILVAGGGGGCGYGGSACDDVGGAGGGLTGSDGTNRGGYGGGKGGSQTAGGLSGMNNTIGAGGFGFGGDAVQCNDEGGGGGGWYGGGAGGEDNRPGGGGSSYIAGVSNGATQTGGNNSHGWAEYIFR